ncbi:iron chaperone [Streptomyces gardneri]|uniref:iron chaperone n=1 Tax=Streptomyces gardneri TaxID=66892 RepID=UPI0036885DD4
MTNTQKSAKTTAKTTAGTTAEAETKAEAFTAEERSAMKERAKEVRASARRGSRADKAAEEEAAVVAKIAEMQDSDRVMAERIHAVVKESAPELAPKLWYGMPAYAKDGKVVCFFQSAQKFNARYATFGFNDVANLDDGTMWPAAFALKELSAADEARIAELVKKAVS